MDSLHIPSDGSLIEVPVGALTLGMFVAELDRPWLETPFSTQGFYVREESDIDYIAEHCSYVFVDPRRRTRKPYSPRRGSASDRHKDRVTIKAEFSQAKVDFESAAASIERVFKSIKNKQRVDVDAMKSAITPLIDSVYRNREALAALVRMKGKSDYHYHHSLAVAVWSAILGRHLGMDKETLIRLCLGCSMMDLGMTGVSDKIVNKSSPLISEEIAVVRAHVKAGVKMAQDSGVKDMDILDVIACHHERFDGSGYPLGLQGNHIPLLARVAGLVDSYDAMTTDRPHAPARSSFEVMQELVDVKGGLFQGSLVESFIQTVGMFPTGAIVELNTAEVGVVVEQNRMRRLRPVVVLILDSDKKPRTELSRIDLNKCRTAVDGTTQLWIARELKPGEYGISPDKYFLL